MKNKFDPRGWFVIAVAFWSCFMLPSANAQEESSVPPVSLRAMSFNIRLGVADDGDNHWDKRKDLVIETIKDFDPDFVGTQETWDFQAEYFGQNLPGYTYVGRSRQQDGKGEQCGILFRNSRFDKLIEGYFWLSETPDQPGSKSWDSSLPRMVTWLKLWDRQNLQSFYVINTHFDHRGPLARVASAKLIREFVEGVPASAPSVVTGDFNATVNSEPYQALFEPLGKAPSPLVDTYGVLHRGAATPEGTFNGFKGTDNGARIDWIAVSRGIEIVEADIDRIAFEGRYPSDHFPVTAVIRLQPSGPAAKPPEENSSPK